MKTWKIMQLPNKEFRRKSDGLIMKIDEDGTLYWAGGYDFINTNDEWEEVKEPVSFMEAVKSGKRIRVEHDFIDGDIDYLEENYVSLDEMFWELGENLSGDGVRDVIMNGKFYIED